MKKISFYKKLKLFREYRILLRRNRSKITDVNNGLNLKIDNIGRIYTVYNCDESVSKYGMELAEKYIKEYISQVSALFVNLGMTEYIGVWDITQLSEYSELDFLIIFGFKGFDVSKFYKSLLTYGIAAMLLIISYFIFFF